MPTEPQFRCPTRAAIDGLARRFHLPNTPEMQDWEYEVASAERLPEFLSAFETERLDDDERFTLMETIIESFVECESDNKWQDTWPRIEAYLRRDFELHAHTIWYRASFETPLSDCWEVAAPMRAIYETLSKGASDEVKSNRKQ